MNNEESFWKGDFGNDYTARNINFVENNYQMFKKIFVDVCEDYYSCYNINSIIEFGAGSGQNIQALQRMFPDAEYSAWEINRQAAQILVDTKKINVFEFSILDYDKLNLNNLLPQHNLVLSKGLLIHIHPDNIQKAYDVLYNASNKYILLCEYYAPERQEILYRGEHNKLWKFDFIKPMLDKGCRILDYGFVSKYDKYFEDDLHYFLFIK
jgi:pseudaminic acid biosynthesis-associated methylase